MVPRMADNTGVSLFTNAAGKSLRKEARNNGTMRINMDQVRKANSINDADRSAARIGTDRNDSIGAPTIDVDEKMAMRQTDPDEVELHMSSDAGAAVNADSISLSL